MPQFLWLIVITKSNGFFEDLRRNGCITEKEFMNLFQLQIQKDHKLRKVVPTSENP